MLNISLQTNPATAEYRLKMKGHCNTDVKGKDLVCAAASILCVTMAETLKANKKCLVKEPKVVIHDGKAVLEWQPKINHLVAMRISIDTVMNGFRELEKRYPEAIKIL